MNVFDAIRGRRSIRRFLTREIPEEAIDKLIEALIWAPSAGNLQSRKFYFIKDQAIKHGLARAAMNQTFIAEAPLVIVGCTDHGIQRRYGRRGIELYCIQDVACSLMGMMLLAHEMGLGTVWVGAFYEEDVAGVLNLPEHLRPAAIVPVGWPSRVPAATPRVRPEEAVVWI